MTKCLSVTLRDGSIETHAEATAVDDGGPHSLVLTSGEGKLVALYPVEVVERILVVEFNEEQADPEDVRRAVLEAVELPSKRAQLPPDFAEPQPDPRRQGRSGW